MVLSIQYNTLDIDTNKKDVIERIIDKIMKCPFIEEIKLLPSLQKGFHIKLWCKRKCEICRIVYDDALRYHYDQERPNFSQNVLFDSKSFHKKQKGGLF